MSDEVRSSTRTPPKLTPLPYSNRIAAAEQSGRGKRTALVHRGLGAQLDVGSVRSANIWTDSQGIVESLSWVCCRYIVGVFWECCGVFNSTGWTIISNNFSAKTQVSDVFFEIWSSQHFMYYFKVFLLKYHLRHHVLCRWAFWLKFEAAKVIFSCVASCPVSLL